MSKELAGNFSFGKLQVNIKEDVHGDKQAYIKIKIDPLDAAKWTALAVMPGVMFNADIFVTENPVFGGKSA